MIASPTVPKLNGQALQGTTELHRGAAADEGVLIARLLFDGAFARLHGSAISDSLFRDPTWKHVYHALQAELRRTGDIDPAVIRGVLDDRLSPDEAFERRSDLSEYGQFREVAARGALKRLIERRQADLVSGVAKTVAAQVGTPSMTVEDARAMLADTLAATESSVAAKLGTLADTLLSDPADEDHERIRTGVEWFDKKMPDGALRPGDLMALAGPPGVGKTALVLQLGIAAIATNRDLHVLWCAGEMTERAIRNRVMSCMSGLPVTILRRPWADLSPLQEQAKRAAIERLHDLGQRFHFVMSPLTPQAVEAGILATGAKLVVIDYLQLMRPEKIGTSRRDDIDGILREIVRMGQTHSVATIAISDMPKGRSRGRDIFDAFKETGEIPYAADLAFVGELVGVDEDTRADDLPDEVDVTWRCLKARHGPARSIKTRFRRYCQQFEGIGS